MRFSSRTSPAAKLISPLNKGACLKSPSSGGPRIRIQVPTILELKSSSALLHSLLHAAPCVNLTGIWLV